MSDWVRVDASWLPENWETNSYLTVELYDDGQLKSLTKSRDGVKLESLTLEHGLPRGRHTVHRGSGGSADWTSHTDGFSENFDAWSDNSKPYKDPFEVFVRRSIKLVNRA